jgi:hypothetical protein
MVRMALPVRPRGFANEARVALEGSVEIAPLPPASALSAWAAGLRGLLVFERRELLSGHAVDLRRGTGIALDRLLEAGLGLDLLRCCQGWLGEVAVCLFVRGQRFGKAGHIESQPGKAPPLAFRLCAGRRQSELSFRSWSLPA